MELCLYYQYYVLIKRHNRDTGSCILALALELESEY